MRVHQLYVGATGWSPYDFRIRATNRSPLQLEGVAIKVLFAKGSQSGLRVIVLIALAIMLMIFDKRSMVVGQLRLALSVPLSSLQYLVSWPVNWIDNMGQMMSTHDALVKENLRLKAEQLLLKAQVQRLMAIESENNQLKALSKTATQVQGHTEIAELLAVDMDLFIRQVILGKGTRDGVYVGQPVLDAGGLMGQVIQVGPMVSRVLLINDPRSGVPVQDTRNGIRAIAMGDSHTGKLRLMNIPQTADIRVGDVFVTSGLGRNYPEGYPVGQVVQVANDPATSFALITVEPDAQLDKSRQVLLVWPNKTVNSTKGILKNA